MENGSDSILIAVIAATPPAIVALITALVTFKKLQVLHIDLNSRLTEMLEIMGAKERAEGVLEGRKLGERESQNRVQESERVEDRKTEQEKGNG